MSTFFEEMRGAIVRHGGTVEKFAGDEVMAVFGAPVAHEDDALRVVRAADEMLTAVQALDEALERERGVRFRLRMGSTRRSRLSRAGGRGWTFVTGSAVNMGKRLNELAEPGDAVLGEATMRLVRDAVDVEPLGSVVLRGKAEPLQAFRPSTSVRSDAPGVARAFDSPFVGRRDEVDVLRIALDVAQAERRCRLLALVGNAGIGKTRIAREFVESLDDAPAAAGRVGHRRRHGPQRDLVHADPQRRGPGVGWRDPDRAGGQRLAPRAGPSAGRDPRWRDAAAHRPEDRPHRGTRELARGPRPGRDSPDVAPATLIVEGRDAQSPFAGASVEPASVTIMGNRFWPSLIPFDCDCWAYWLSAPAAAPRYPLTIEGGRAGALRSGSSTPASPRTAAAASRWWPNPSGETYTISGGRSVINRPGGTPAPSPSTHQISDGPAVAVTVHVQDLFLWPLLAVLLGVAIAGLVTRYRDRDRVGLELRRALAATRADWLARIASASPREQAWFGVLFHVPANRPGLAMRPGPTSRSVTRCWPGSTQRARATRCSRSPPVWMTCARSSPPGRR